MRLSARRKRSRLAPSRSAGLKASSRLPDSLVHKLHLKGTRDGETVNEIGGSSGPIRAGTPLHSYLEMEPLYKVWRGFRVLQQILGK